ncbi:hypothetical protein N1851_027857 [Merluccius polli]|uniref:DUF6729 domain-containing protein n=1 Tax=Merluccius polli TaxID=89951 RepID=A0AA47M9R0_MERPO|nr:hypothetical protein N1851_027857 [Merluccius polli]
MEEIHCESAAWQTFISLTASKKADEEEEEEEEEEELISAVSQCEAQLNTALATTVHVEACADPPPAAIPDLNDHQPPAELPSPWKDQLPRFQQDWIRRALFQANPQTGKRELVSKVKLWWYPPQPLLIHTQPPASPDHFFGRPLFLWMTRKMFHFPLVCVRPACGKHKLTAAGLYQTVRPVLLQVQLLGAQMWETSTVKFLSPL